MRSLQALRWRSIYGYLLLIAVLLGLAGALLYFEASYLYRTRAEDAHIALAQRATELQAVRDAWESDASSMEAMLAQLQALSGAVVRAFGPDGEALATSTPVPDDVQEQATTPELRAALRGTADADLRTNSAGDKTFYVAVPVSRNGVVAGALQFAFPAASVDASISRLRDWIVLAFALSAIALSAMIVFMSVRTTRKLQLLKAMVDRITQGDLDARVLTLHSGEIGQLTSSLNRMADRLQSQTRKRRREKDRLNTVLHTMNDGIVILNRSGEVRTMNPAAARILDVPLRQSQGRSFVQVARDFRIAAVWTRCLNTGVEQSATIDLANDTSVHVVITPFLKRRARGYLVLIQDLTQLRHLQTVRQDFVSNVSHELRTPLASMRALVDTLRDGALEDPPAAIRFLDRMDVEVDALTQMVQELMELSRIESGQVPLQRMPVHPEDVIVPAVERLRPQAERAGLELTADIDGALPKVTADAERAQQIVTNLVHNAIKFTPSGGSVDVRAVHDGDVVRITVRDTGIGIAPEDIERVFERFYKADRSRAFGGTGLGLSIASHLVQAHGGEIWAESVEDEGSEFGFSLPLAEPVPASTASTSAGGEQLPAPEPLHTTESAQQPPA